MAALMISVRDIFENHPSAQGAWWTTPEWDCPYDTDTVLSEIDDPTWLDQEAHFREGEGVFSPDGDPFLLLVPAP